MDLSIDDSRKADIVEAMLLRGGDKDCLFKSLAQDYVKDMQGDLSQDYIECGGLLWARDNIEVDGKRHYTFDEASECGAPTKAELEAFIERTYYGFDKIRKVGIFVDRETGVRLELPANGSLVSREIMTGAGIGGFYWSTTQGGKTEAYGLYFSKSTVVVSRFPKTYGLSVRCVRR